MRLEDYIEEYPKGFKLTEGIDDKGIFKAVFMGGMPGAGKSYVLKKIKSGQLEPRIVNTDKFKEFFGEWRTKASFDRSKKLTSSQLSLYLNSMLPLFVDATSSIVSAIIVRNNILENLGYDTAMVFVNVTTEDSHKESLPERKRGSRGVCPRGI